MSRTRTSLLLVAIAFITALSLPHSLAAQDSGTGALRGTVLDSTGGRIAQASIVVVNSANGTRYAATSDSEGRFAFELLPPGDYSARVEAQSMSPQITPPLHVDVGGTADLEFRLTGRQRARKPHSLDCANPRRNSTERKLDAPR